MSGKWQAMKKKWKYLSTENQSAILIANLTILVQIPCICLRSIEAQVSSCHHAKTKGYNKLFRQAWRLWSSPSTSSSLKSTIKHPESPWTFCFLICLVWQGVSIYTNGLNLTKESGGNSRLMNGLQSSSHNSSKRQWLLFYPQRSDLQSLNFTIIMCSLYMVIKLLTALDLQPSPSISTPNWHAIKLFNRSWNCSTEYRS